MQERRDLLWLRLPAPDRESSAFVTATATRLPDLQAEATRPRRTDAVTSDTSSALRTSAFFSAVPFINQHLWLGRGFGTFLPATYFFTDDQYLLSFIEIGAIGVLCLLGLFVTGWMTARNARRRSVNPQTRDLAQSMAASVAVPAVAFVTFIGLHRPL
jgi:polysaccharide biosynthesis protein PslJ